MDDDLPDAQPGRLIEQARIRLGISQNEAAERAGMSGTRWRQIVKGDAGPLTSRRGIATLARMAQVVGVTPDQFAETGREDVSSALRKASPDEPERADQSDEELTTAELIAKAEELMAKANEYLRRARGETG